MFARNKKVLLRVKPFQSQVSTWFILLGMALAIRYTFLLLCIQFITEGISIIWHKSCTRNFVVFSTHSREIFPKIIKRREKYVLFIYSLTLIMFYTLSSENFSKSRSNRFIFWDDEISTQSLQRKWTHLFILYLILICF